MNEYKNFAEFERTVQTFKDLAMITLQIHFMTRITKSGLKLED